VAAKFQALAVIPRLQALFFLSGFSSHALAGDEASDKILTSVLATKIASIERRCRGRERIFADNTSKDRFQTAQRILLTGTPMRKTILNLDL
jgi:hypothetical protein